MIAQLKPYPTYKESGIEELGNVPTHWPVSPLSALGSFFKGKGASKEDEVEAGIPCVRYGDLYTQHEFFIRRTRAFIAPERADSYTQIRFGEVLFAGSGETIEDIGRSAVVLMDGEVRCGGDVIGYRANSGLAPRFLGYACDCAPAKVQKARMGRGFTVVHIYPSELKRLVLAVPSPEEQDAIVRYLDYMDRRIRRYLRAKQKLIALLNEQKQAIIHRAVTRGLDPSVLLKPSGIEWLGDIPAHWSLQKLKYLTRFQNGLAFKPSDWESQGVPIIRIQNLNGSDQFNYTRKDDLPDSLLIKKGDLLFSWSGNRGTSFGSFIWDRGFPGYLNQHIFKLEDYKLDRRYFAHLLRAVTRQIEEETHGIIGLVHITKPELGAVLVPVAPPEEQVAIAQWIESRSATIELSISSERKGIALLREYRARLIADVVTGKLDVREAAAALPAEEAKTEEPLDEIAESEIDTEDADLEVEEVEA